MSAQTINGYAVQFLESGMVSPDWTRPAFITSQNLSGTGITIENLTGYGSYVLQVAIQVVGNDDDAAAHRAIRALLGQTVIVGGWLDPDGASPLSAMLAAYNVRPLAGGAAGYEGSIELRKSGSS